MKLEIRSKLSPKLKRRKPRLKQRKKLKNLNPKPSLKTLMLSPHQLEQAEQKVKRGRKALLQPLVVDQLSLSKLLKEIVSNKRKKSASEKRKKKSKGERKKRSVLES